jgi:uncharacterized protein YdeI (BOF family)
MELCSKQESSLALNLPPKVARKIIGRAQINGTAQERGQFDSHAAEVEEAHACRGEELDEDVNVALRGKIVAQNATEEREASDAVQAVEVSETIDGDGNRKVTHERVIQESCQMQ